MTMTRPATTRATIALAREATPPSGEQTPTRRETRGGPRWPRLDPASRPARRLDDLRRWLGEHTFLPEWLPERWRHPVWSFVAAALLEIGAVLATLTVVQVLPTYSYLGTLELLLVAVVALIWGAGPALCATLLGALLLEYAVLPIRAGPQTTMAENLIEVGVLLAIGGTMSLIASRVERGRRRALEARSEAQAREMAAREANRHMDEFLGVAGHELRNPLATMLATIQLIERRLRRLGAQPLEATDQLGSRLEPIQELLGRAERQVQLQNRLVGDLLDVSRIQANRLDLRPHLCDLAAIVSDAVEEQRLSWPTRTITLESVAAATVRADADRIGQVVTNFLTNALKYSAADRPVRVSLQVKEKMARVRVRDEGPGLPAEEQRRVWGRFHRAAGVQVRDGGGVGLGLGLHISRTIIERHDGTVGIDSALGKGSTFWFTLPIAT